MSSHIFSAPGLYMRIGGQIIRSQRTLVAQITAQSLSGIRGRKSTRSQSVLSSFRTSGSQLLASRLGISTPFRTSTSSNSRTSARSTIQGVRQELLAIRDLLGQDRNQSLSAAGRSGNQKQIDDALRRINDLAQPAESSESGSVAGDHFTFF